MGRRHLYRLKSSLYRKSHANKSIIYAEYFPKFLRNIGIGTYRFLYHSQQERFIYPRNSFEFQMNEKWNSSGYSYNTKVLIDAQCLQGGSLNRGIGRYSKSLLKSLVAQNPKVQFILLFNNLSPMEKIEIVMNEVANDLNNVTLQICELPLTDGRIAESDAISHITKFVQEIQPHFILFLSIFEHPFDVIPISLQAEFKTVGIYYDLIPLEYHQIFLANPEARMVFDFNLARLTSLNILLSISDSSSRYLLENAKFEGILSTISGASYFQSKPGHGLEILQRSGVLCVGSDSVHKNIATLISAYAMLPESVKNNHRLNLVGVHMNFLSPSIKLLVKELEGRITFVQFITDSQLQDLYRQVRLTVAPSFIEGLGMPILEAWNEGCVAIGSENTSLSDIIDSSDLCFDPRSPEELCTLMKRLLTDDVFWIQEQNRLISRRSHFTWDATSNKVSELLNLE